jgi:hypothetical protein
VRRRSPSGHGARSGSSSSTPAKRRLPLPLHNWMRGGTSMLADHLLPVKDLHYAGELHAPWPRNTLDLVVHGLGDAQLE